MPARGEERGEGKRTGAGQYVKMGRVPVGGVPHIKILQYKKKKGTKEKSGGKRKKRHEKIGEGHRQCVSPG